MFFTLPLSKAPSISMISQNPYYPDDPVSVRALLTHTSSIPVLDDDASQARWAVIFPRSTALIVKPPEK